MTMSTKRYERLSALRSKAMTGKGTWYWAHLKPVMVPADAAGSALLASAKLQCVEIGLQSSIPNLFNKSLEYFC
ncbi:hypothetical protein ZIOFF_035844 [Zingiber officinale]|uniref:DUF7963 domain-containing protein n=1 Tax=Zingiber officinale TaxID=94328 RepID=A0A8J5L113_ZINOF|nr:hypothetical protein ZIOFF_035844 [Zingiber officinale]